VTGMNEIKPEYKLSDKITCPYCQSKIKQESEIIYCNICGTPHHKECWDENNGCTTYGCIKNPVTEKRPAEGTDIGNRTIEEIEQILGQKLKKEVIEEIVCYNCNKAIDNNSVYCKFCGVKSGNSEKKVSVSKFEEEYRKKYKENLRLKKRTLYLTYSSIGILAILLFVVLYYTYRIIDNRIKSGEHKIKNLVTDWNSAFRNKEPEELKGLYEKDFIYYDKAGKEINLDKRLKQLSGFIKSEKYNNSLFTDIDIRPDSTSANYIFVLFKQNFYYEKEIKTENRFFKLFRGNESGDKWRIFREYHFN